MRENVNTAQTCLRTVEAVKLTNSVSLNVLNVLESHSLMRLSQLVLANMLSFCMKLDLQSREKKLFALFATLSLTIATFARVRLLTLLIQSLLKLSFSLILKKADKMILMKSLRFSREKHIGIHLLNVQYVRHHTLLMSMETVFLNLVENMIISVNVLLVTPDLDLNQRHKNLNVFLTANIPMKRQLQENAALLALTDSISQKQSLLRMKNRLNVPHVW